MRWAGRHERLQNVIADDICSLSSRAARSSTLCAVNRDWLMGDLYSYESKHGVLPALVSCRGLGHGFPWGHVRDLAS